MPTRRQLIQKITLNSNSSSITFSNIPQNYTDLKIYYSSRNSATGPTATASIIRMNGETSNHSSRRIEGFAGSVSSNYFSTSSYLDIIPGSDNTSNTFNSVEVYIPSYSSSNIKSYRSTSALSGNSANYGSIDIVTGMWSGTSSITSITLIPSSGGYSTNSTFYLYGITHVPIIRGGEEYVSGGFKYHKFTSTAALQVIEPGDVEYLVVAGGGSGGGQYSGGGGGAGGFLSGKSRLSSGISSIIIGAGGSPAAQNTDGGNNGSNTEAFGLTSTGGGRGGRYPGVAGASGGSGGGGGDSGGSGGSGTSGQGNSGGNGASNAGGGGGGAGAIGANASTNTGGNGGAGKIWLNNNYYAGGGGGGGTTTIGIGGIGGGGNGSNYTVFTTSGLANTGGGGGGIRESVGLIAGAGGSGIVIIRYPYDGN